MSNGDVLTANHRCPERISKIRILRDYQKYGVHHSGWHLYNVVPDYEWDCYATMNVTPIWYCPFCGKKLEEEKKDV